MLHFLLRTLRFLAYGLDLLVSTVLLYPLTFLPRALARRVYRPVFRIWCRAFVRALGVDLRLHQHNLRELPGHYILIANHPSAFEDIGIPALFPVDSVAKIEVRDWWIVGRISDAAGCIYVQREDADSRQQAYRSIIDALRQGRNIAVYPEGGCKGKRIFETFRYGPFDISLQTGVPILPVFLHYEAQHDFEWRPGVPLLVKITEILRSSNKTAHYHVYDPFDPAGFSDKVEYMETVRARYLEWQRQYLE